MAKAVALIISTLCVLAFAGIAYSHEPEFFVNGKVYCDTCRVQFLTRISQPIKGARLAVECRDRDNGTLTHNAIGVSDDNGDYRLLVKGDHEKDICEVKAIKSPRTDCCEPMEGLDRARIALTGKNGLLSSDRYANPLGFMKTYPLPECTEVLEELGFFPLAN